MALPLRWIRARCGSMPRGGSGRASHLRTPISGLLDSVLTPGSGSMLPQLDTNINLDLPPSLPETIRVVQQISSAQRGLLRRCHRTSPGVDDVRDRGHPEHSWHEQFATEASFSATGMLANRLTKPHLGEDEAMVGLSIGTVDRLCHQPVLIVTPPDEDISQQVPVSQPGCTQVTFCRIWRQHSHQEGVKIPVELVIEVA
ncbi:unnamed protein product [Schistocephalus solidus]|uniref:Archease domain-containing protein n=1 Tax=Schistocephalus solidus TaxID=70667 RepID=A0A183SF22_SCHSO|nr:unnamed protein product [Schistocephalus solidus]